MITISVDPSIANVGVFLADGRQIIECKTINTKPADPMADRIKYIYGKVAEIIDTYNVGTMVIEEMNYYTRKTAKGISINVEGLMKLNRSCGVIEAIALERGMKIIYSPAHKEPAHVQKYLSENIFPDLRNESEHVRSAALHYLKKIL